MIKNEAKEKGISTLLLNTYVIFSTIFGPSFLQKEMLPCTYALKYPLLFFLQTAWTKNG